MNKLVRKHKIILSDLNLIRLLVNSIGLLVLVGYQHYIKFNPVLEVLRVAFMIEITFLTVELGVSYYKRTCLIKKDEDEFSKMLTDIIIKELLTKGSLVIGVYIIMDIFDTWQSSQSLHSGQWFGLLAIVVVAFIYIKGLLDHTAYIWLIFTRDNNKIDVYDYFSNIKNITIYLSYNYNFDIEVYIIEGNQIYIKENSITIKDRIYKRKVVVDYMKEAQKKLDSLTDDDKLIIEMIGIS